jgi:hypothetical protein
VFSAYILKISLLIFLKSKSYILLSVWGFYVVVNFSYFVFMNTVFGEKDKDAKFDTDRL